MNDDDFERAVRALRDEGDQPAPQTRLTRERILRDLRPRARRRRRAVWMVPLAALLAGSTVLAATGRLPEVFHAAALALGLEVRPAAPAATRPLPPRAALSAPAASVAVNEARGAERAGTPEPSGATAPTVAGDARTLLHGDAGVSRRGRVPRRSERENVAEVASVVAAPTPGSSASAASAAAATAVASSAAGPSDDQGALSLYRRARQLHFVEQKPAAALAAWDAYLAADPSGPLSVDARYERALCLVRLGRKSEARAALEPFAVGKYGGYRQGDARALLDALE